MKKRNRFNIMPSLLLLIILSLTIGVAIETRASQGSKAKEDSMDLAHKTKSQVIPSIDANAPKNFETASFGLG